MAYVGAGIVLYVAVEMIYLSVLEVWSLVS
jgi:hypothetical protein